MLVQKYIYISRFKRGPRVGLGGDWKPRPPGSRIAPFGAAAAPKVRRFGPWGGNTAGDALTNTQRKFIACADMNVCICLI